MMNKEIAIMMDMMKVVKIRKNKTMMMVMMMSNDIY